MCQTKFFLNNFYGVPLKKMFFTPSLFGTLVRVPTKRLEKLINEIIIMGSVHELNHDNLLEIKVEIVLVVGFSRMIF